MRPESQGDGMKERSPIKGWFSKWSGVTPVARQPAPSAVEEPNGRHHGNGEATARHDHGMDDMREQLAKCLARLEDIDVQLRDSRHRAAADDERMRRDSEELRRHSEELGRQLQQTEELRRHLQQTEDAVAERDRHIEQLTHRIHGQQEQLAAAESTSQRLEAALAAEQQARQLRENTKSAAYQELRRGIVAAVQRAVPIDATVLVVSKGDDRLLELDGRNAWHFPRAEDGRYLGYHPYDSAAAIVHLEELRGQGGQYLVFPATAAWWLDHYAGLKQHLDTRCTNVPTVDDSCVIYALTPGPQAAGAAIAGDNRYREVEAAIESFRAAFHRWPAILDWHSGLRLSGAIGQHSVFSPPANDGPLPYLDRTIDMVVCGSNAAARDEARRVASSLIVTVDGNETGAAPRVEVEWLTDRVSSALDASIIIPCYNGAEITEACLAALTATLPRSFAGQIIVFDDGSTDDTRERVRRWTKRDRRVKLKWRDTNGGFLDAANRASKAATGEYLVFLNNDTEPYQGWLTALLDTFTRFPDAGAVGGKLVLPDGTLQEAGGVIFRDGSAANFMRGETNLEAPLVNYVREVDYCSGALMATPRQLFTALGGFDARYKPAYYEDVDYCFKVRQAGKRVYYQPASATLHREGASCGTDVTRGVKRYQVRNQRVFAAQWKNVLHGQPVRPPDGDVSAWRALADRRPVETP